MPLTGYLLIDDIPGESQRADHEDEIDIYDIAWGIEQAASVSLGRGRRRARAEAGPVRLRKFYDAASPYLALAVQQGKALPKAVLSVRKDSGEAHLDYLVITMENVMISAYELSTSEDDQRLTETVEIEFEQMTIKYTVQADDHSAGDEHEVEISG